MPDQMTDRELADEVWYWYLTGKNKVGFPKEFLRDLNRLGRLFGMLPGKSRCVECNVPLDGAGAWVMKPFGYGPSVLTPRLCNGCEKMILSTEGGAEVGLSLLFADIRGSTPMAAQKGAMEYKDFIQRFYKTSVQILIEHNALVNRLVGDQVIGLFTPRFAGANHAAVAIEAAVELLRLTGHTDPERPLGSGGHRCPHGFGLCRRSRFQGRGERDRRTG